MIILGEVKMSQTNNPDNKNLWPDEGNTGHIWDEDIRELDNPPPLWWILAFYAGFVMIVFYVLYYPSIPLINDHTKGLAGWTQVNEAQESYEVLTNWRQRTFADKEEQLSSLDVADILKDDELRNYAINTSKVLYGDYCMACHGSGGQGNPNFPVLADDDWLWGGSIQQIEASIKNGRKGVMPARGMSGNLTDEEVEQVSDFVIALAEGNGDSADFAAGKALYGGKGMCMACHGPAGKPLAPAGATDLTDSIWRFGNFRGADLRAEVIQTVKYGVGQANENSRQAEMPPFKDRLPDAERNVKRLAIFVHAMGGGQ